MATDLHPSRERFELDWTPPTATETARVRQALDHNRKRRNALDRQRTLERVRAELDQGPLSVEECRAFASSIGRAYAEAEARRRPHPQEEMPL